MQKQEFEERIERTVTDEQYKVIEEVYMWHPSIRNTSGKDEVAELYKSFGMTIFHDMLPRAKKAHELDELLRNAQREVQRIQEEISKKAVEDAKERFKSSFVSYGKMVIYTYLPKELLPESFEDLTFEEFFELYGQADCAREMRIEDIETGVAKGIADNFSNDE